MLGLVSSFIHGTPGFYAPTALGLRDAHTVVTVRESIVIDAINGLCWGLVYGGLGYLMDRRRDYPIC